MEIRMSKKWLIALASTLLFAPMSWALGLGEIEIKSKLNQPLDAEIQITSASDSELDAVVFSIPTDAVFDRYDLDRPEILNTVRFVVENRGSSNKVIRLFSAQVVKDPFLTFLIQADWPQGRMLREYTVLVDPPLFVPSQNDIETKAYVDGATVNTRDNSNSQGAIEGRTESVGTGNATGNFDYNNFSSSEASGDSYRVKRGDTLWEIANSLKPDDSFSVNQTMMAIFRSNPDAFEGNINRLKSGQVLSVPTRNQINSFTQQSANQAVRSQTRDWRDSTGDYQSSTVVNSTVGSSTADTQSDSQESSEGRLELKVPDLDADAEIGGLELDGEGLGGSESDSQVVNELQAKVDEFERLLSAKDNELASLQQELAKAREMTAAVDANETEALTEVPVDSSQESSGTETEVETSTDISTTTPEIVEAIDTQTPVISTPEEEGGLFALLKKIAIGLGLVLLGLFGFLFLRNRNKGPSHDTLFVDEDLDNAVEDIAERVKSRIDSKYSGTSEVEILKEAVPGFEVVESDAPTDDDFNVESDVNEPEVGRITETIESDEALPFDDTTLADVSMASMDVDANDPIAETDFHMAYGLYDQAADIMSSAITDTDDFKFKEKLLEVFFVSGNKEEFTRFAAELKEEAQANHPSVWENVIIMGKQLAPEEDMFSGDISTAGIDEGLDFSLDETGQIDVDQSLFSDLEEIPDSEVVSNDVVDLDFSEDLEVSALDTDDDVLDISLDLDLPEAPVDIETSALDTDDDVLDISLSLELPEAPVDLEGVIEDFSSDLDASLNTQVSDLEQIPDVGATKEINVKELLDLDLGSAMNTMEVRDFSLTNDETVSENDESDETLDFSFDLNSSDDLSSDDLTLNVSDETLDFSFDLNSSDDLSSDDLTLDVSDETQNLADDFLDTLDIGDTRTQKMKVVENFDLLLDGDSEATTSGLDLDLETLLSDGEDPFSDDTKRSMLPDGVNESDTGTMSLNTLTEDNMQEIKDVLNPDDIHASTSQITDEELMAMGLSDNGPELMGVTGTGMSLDESESVDENSTKLDLARAYIEMDDPENAKSILQEVVDEGDSAQQNEAKNLIATLS